MKLEEPKHLLNFLCYLFILFHCYNAERVIDMEGYDCVRMQPFQISDYDLVRIIAQPRHDLADSYICQITLQALPGRHFKVYVADIDIKECGVSLTFYNDLVHSQNVAKKFDCLSVSGTYFESRSNVLIVKVNKLTSSSTVYSFSIVTATNLGPKIERANCSPGFNSYSTFRIFFIILAYFTLY